MGFGLLHSNIEIMKKISFIVLFFAVCLTANAQVAIGKTTVDGSGILDFASGTTNGILLPIVETLPAASAIQNGTFLMDKNDKKIKMCENGSWVELSDEGSIANYTFNTAVEAGNGAIIGAETSSVTGVLVLEANNKALILPRVAAPEVNVKSPVAGMMVYDSTSKSVAVFDGLKWNYWK
jgi:hypothetical protein